MIRIGSLFTGIAGLDRGVEQALAQLGQASRVEWQAEKDPYARAVLAKHRADTPGVFIARTDTAFDQDRLDRELARMLEQGQDPAAHRLRCLGNGVVAEQAALAFVTLAQRAGLVGGDVWVERAEAVRHA